MYSKGVSNGTTFKKIFESLVSPVFDYGASIWSHSIAEASLDRLQLMACRSFLRVNKQHPIAAIMGDMCWMPTKCRHQLQTVMLWFSVMHEDGEIYISGKELCIKRKVKNWAHQPFLVILS